MALVLACALAPSGYGQNGPSFALRIMVQDAHHQPVVGADCSLTSAASAKVPVVKAISDSQGFASLTNLQSGSYTLTVMKEGFESLTRTNIFVGQAPETEIAIVLAIAAVTEQVTITTPGEASTSVAAGSNTPAGNLKRDSLRTLPLALARVDEALPLIPGVVRSAKGELSIKGASEQQSALLVNGVNANDPSTGNFRLNLPIDSVEAVQVFQHPYTGEYGKFIGGLTRVETRRGAEKWHFELNDFLPDFRFKNGKLVGVAEDTPRLNFNGPLIKDHLYLSQSAAYSIAKRPVRGLPFPVNETKTESQNPLRRTMASEIFHSAAVTIMNFIKVCLNPRFLFDGLTLACGDRAPKTRRLHQQSSKVITLLLLIGTHRVWSFWKFTLLRRSRSWEDHTRSRVDSISTTLETISSMTPIPFVS